MEFNDKMFLETQLKRVITNLFKGFLVVAEDIRQEHLGVVSEISAQFPSELLTKWNYLDLPKYSRIRKKILDSGNDAIREVNTILNDFEITLNNKN